MGRGESRSLQRPRSALIVGRAALPLALRVAGAKERLQRLARGEPVRRRQREGGRVWAGTAGGRGGVGGVGVGLGGNSEREAAGAEARLGGGSARRFCSLRSHVQKSASLCRCESDCSSAWGRRKWAPAQCGPMGSDQRLLGAWKRSEPGSPSSASTSPRYRRWIASISAISSGGKSYTPPASRLTLGGSRSALGGSRRLSAALGGSRRRRSLLQPDLASRVDEVLAQRVVA